MKQKRQKPEKTTAASEENYSNMQEKQQQYPEKTTAASEKNIPKSLTDSVQKFLSFVQKQIFLYKTRPKQREKIRKEKESFPEKASEFIKLDNNYKS